MNNKIVSDVDFCLLIYPAFNILPYVCELTLLC